MNYPNLEIISLHIAKTGGKTFVNLMKDLYGNEKVIRFRKVKYEVLNNDYSIELKNEASIFNVLHGHFLYNEVKDIHLNSNAKVITWLRDPVERVISRYFYLQKRIEQDPNHIQKEKKDMGLLNYAALPSQRNVMSQYVNGIAIENLFFIGILEYFDQSIEEFKQLFNFTNKVEIPWDNNNQEYKSKYAVSQEERNEILNLNKKDLELYNMVLKLKGIKK